MQNHGAHVPKFGNWESENVAYSACFERAHREKSGTTSFRTSTNPNDPEALNLYNIGGGGDDGSNSHNSNSGIDVTFEGVSKGSSSSSNSHGRNLVKQRSLTMTTRASECVNDVTVLNRREKKGVTKGRSNSVGGNFSSQSQGGHEARRSLGIGTHASHDFSVSKPLFLLFPFIHHKSTHTFLHTQLFLLRN